MLTPEQAIDLRLELWSRGVSEEQLSVLFDLIENLDLEIVS